MIKNPVIDIHNISFTYGYHEKEEKVLDNLSLKIYENEFIILAGKNASGKTTLLKHFNGLLKPYSGSVKIDNICVNENILHARQKIGLVFQDADSQIIGETVWDDIAFGPQNLGFKKNELKNIVESALEDFGLTKLKNRACHSLSGGEKRRVAIAGIVAMNPKLIALDEPFSNLDYPGAADLIKCLERLHKKGTSIIISTHDIEKVISLATRVIIMENGKIKKDSLPKESLTYLENFGIRPPCFYKMGAQITPWVM